MKLCYFGAKVKSYLIPVCDEVVGEIKLRDVSQLQPRAVAQPFYEIMKL